MKEFEKKQMANTIKDYGVEYVNKMMNLNVTNKNSSDYIKGFEKGFQEGIILFSKHFARLIEMNLIKLYD